MRPATSRAGRRAAATCSMRSPSPPRPGARGVVVAFAGTLHSAPRRAQGPLVRGSMRSPPATPGRSARIEAGRLRRVARRGPPSAPLGLERLPPAGAPWPWVEIVASARRRRRPRGRARWSTPGVDGLVVAGTGNGSVHRELAAALEQAALPARHPGAARRPAASTAAWPTKDEPSAFASAGDLTPVKARVELVLQLLRARRPGARCARLRRRRA